jgi:hypothetical protein
LSAYLELKYQIFKEIDLKTANTDNPMFMAKWLKQKSIDKDNLTFKEALIDWIIYDY